MIPLLQRWSLGTRMVVVFSCLLAAIGLFMVVFFPARMARQAHADAEARAASIAQVMSTALGPALEFDDPENASTILAWLASTRDARFGMVRDADGPLIAAWHPDAIPQRVAWPTEFSIESTDDILIVTTPIQGLAGGRGTLHVGFSLEQLVIERDKTRRTVALTTAFVLGLGILATMLLAAFVVRPIRTLTRTARRISLGEMPAELPTVAGGGTEVARLADALRAMLERIHEVSQRELLSASRHAGMAEVATGVLHNVGNVLTSVNVAVEMLRERLDAMPFDRLRRLHELLTAALATGSVERERVAAAAQYVAVVTEALDRGRGDALRDVGVLGGHIDHIKRVVAMQNAYARLRSVVETTHIPTLLDETVEIACPPSKRGDLELELDIAPSLVADHLMIDRHRVMQIVVNLVSNARDAVRSGTSPRRIRVAAAVEDGSLAIRVTDSGVGIPADLLKRIFSAGFTSKSDGHGYGLHSSSLAARQMGGSLEVASAGQDRGATS